MYEHIVVGAGVNGLSAAYQLAKRGRKVLLLEKFPLPHSRGSSHGQSRGIRKAYPDPFFTNIMEHAYKEWKNIEQLLGIKLIKQTGLLCFSDEKNNIFMEQTIGAFKASTNADYELFNNEEMKQKYPYLKLGNEAYACYDPTGGILMADKALKALQDLSLKLGVTILDGFEVEKIDQKNEVVTVTGTNKISFSANSLVVCPGPWASQILSKLGINLPLIPVKIPVYYWKVKEFLPHTFIYEGHAGGNVWGLPEHEYPGLVKICLHEGPAADPDKREMADTQHLKDFLVKFIGEHFPGVEPKVSVEESCMYTNLPDENPVIDMVPGTNIVIAVGFSGTGFKLGPVSGNMIADLATGVHQRQPQEILSLRRFQNYESKLNPQDDNNMKIRKYAESLKES